MFKGLDKIFPCGSCDKQVEFSGVCCDKCDIWHCRSCLDLSTNQNISNLGNESWQCFKCNKVNCTSFVYHEFNLDSSSSTNFSFKSVNQDVSNSTPNRCRPIAHSSPYNTSSSSHSFSSVHSYSSCPSSHSSPTSCSNLNNSSTSNSSKSTHSGKEIKEILESL